MILWLNVELFSKSTENRQFGTISVAKRSDIGEVLVSEGLAVTQHHRDDEEKSPRYDLLVAAENIAKAAEKGVHSSKEYKTKTTNDLTDPKKAKAYSGSLVRAGKLKAIVEYVFSGSRFKVFVPTENCHIMFACENIKSPQPSAPQSVINRGQARPAEPFGDASKRHARLSVQQRSVEILCKGVTNGGVVTGELYVGGGAQRREFGLELVASGLANVDQRKIDYGEASNSIVNAQTHAKNNKVGLWSVFVEKQAVCTITKLNILLGFDINNISNRYHFFNISLLQSLM
jgi:staphylococcal nuclease domain-containing protein 1